MWAPAQPPESESLGQAQEATFYWLSRCCLRTLTFENYRSRNTKHFHAASSCDSLSHVLTHASSSFLLVAPAPSTAQPCSFNFWLQWLTSQTTAGCYPSWHSSPTDNVVTVPSPPPAPPWYTDRHLEGPGIHPSCTMPSWAGRPMHTQTRSEPSPFCLKLLFYQIHGTWGMEESPRTLNVLCLTFKAFLGIVFQVKWRRFDKTRSSVYHNWVHTRPPFSAPTVGSAHPKTPQWTDCQCSGGSSSHLRSFQSFCPKSRQRESQSCKSIRWTLAWGVQTSSCWPGLRALASRGRHSIICDFQGLVTSILLLLILWNAVLSKSSSTNTQGW